MSGTFNDIDVPPTLCSFAVDVANLPGCCFTGTEDRRATYLVEVHDEER